MIGERIPNSESRARRRRAFGQPLNATNDAINRRMRATNKAKGTRRNATPNRGNATKAWRARVNTPVRSSPAPTRLVTPSSMFGVPGGNTYSVDLLRRLSNSPIVQQLSTHRSVPVGPWSPQHVLSDKSETDSDSDNDHNSQSCSVVLNLTNRFNAVSSESATPLTTDTAPVTPASPPATITPPTTATVPVEQKSTEITPQAVPAIPKSKKREFSKEFLAKRNKQIEFGKDSLSYQMYLLKRPVKERLPSDPRTPRLDQACSKRAWNGRVRRWRRDLHQFDPQNESEWAMARKLFPHYVAQYEARRQAQSLLDDASDSSSEPDANLTVLLSSKATHALKPLSSKAAKASEFQPIAL
mmetsp:Transcript_6611/g.11487  ORF Transcript_6611/g.11487 Transcript_6611/m.11487 type:complete len:356 (+) Transcript_6611:56-1123(+)